MTRSGDQPSLSNDVSSTQHGDINVFSFRQTARPSDAIRNLKQICIIRREIYLSLNSIFKFHLFNIITLNSIPLRIILQIRHFKINKSQFFNPNIHTWESRFDEDFTMILNLSSDFLSYHLIDRIRVEIKLHLNCIFVTCVK